MCVIESQYLMLIQQPGLTDLIQPLLTAEQTLSKHRQWRYHRDLLDTFVHLRHCMTSDQLFNSFVPVLWRCIGVFVSCVLTVILYMYVYYCPNREDQFRVKGNRIM